MISDWIKHYSLEFFYQDVIAALTLLTVVIPQSIAYTSLANLPSRMGLITSIIPSLIYALLGSSSTLVVGTFALTGMMLNDSIDMITTEYEDRKNIARVLSIYSGIVIMLLLPFSRLIKRLLPPILISAISTSAGFHIAKSQIPGLLGLSITQKRLIPGLIEIISKWMEIRWISLCIGMLLLVIILVSDKINARYCVRIPGMVIGLIVTSVVVYVLNMKYDAKIRVVGFIPAGLDLPSIPGFTVDAIVFIQAIKLAIVTMCVSVAIVLHTIDGDVDLRYDVLAFSLGNIGCGLCGGYLSTASLSRTAINGGKTQVSNIITALLVVVVCYNVSILEHIPVPGLSVIVLVAVKNILKQFKSGVVLLFNVVKVWDSGSGEGMDALSCAAEKYSSTIEAIVWWLTFLLVVIIDIDIGIAAGMLCTLIIYALYYLPSLEEMVEYQAAADTEERVSLMTTGSTYDLRRKSSGAVAVNVGTDAKEERILEPLYGVPFEKNKSHPTRVKESLLILRLRSPLKSSRLLGVLLWINRSRIRSFDTVIIDIQGYIDISSVSTTNILFVMKQAAHEERSLITRIFLSVDDALEHVLRHSS